MKGSAKQYAEALRVSVPDVAMYRKTIADLVRVVGYLAADSTIRAFFANRTTLVARQEQVLHDVFHDDLSAQTYAFLRTLIANRQTYLLEQIIRHAERRADAEDNTARVHVVSAVPLTARVRTNLEETLATRMRRHVIAAYEERPSIIGGLRMTIDHATQWDASVAGRLERLQERIRAIV